MSFIQFALKTTKVSGIWKHGAGLSWRIGMAVMYDALYQMLIDSVRSKWLHLPSGPAADSLRLIGQERSIPQYKETWLQYRERLRASWDTWQSVGDESVIINELRRAGYPDARIKRSGISSFVVWFPKSTAISLAKDYSAPQMWGGPVWGGFVWGSYLVKTEDYLAIKSIINHWKPHNWVCSDIVFEMRGTVWGAPVWGGFNWGGNAVVMSGI